MISDSKVIDLGLKTENLEEYLSSLWSSKLRQLLENLGKAHKNKVRISNLRNQVMPVPGEMQC